MDAFVMERQKALCQPTDSSHGKLVRRAAQWLEGKGLEWFTDYRVVYETGPYMERYYIVDVAGWSDAGVVVLVECGNLGKSKAAHLARSFPESYHWPYGEKQPHPMSECGLPQHGGRPRRTTWWTLVDEHRAREALAVQVWETGMAMLAGGVL